MADRNETLEQALDLCVYGPLGAALYARDTVPGFLKAFAARGRAELSRQKGKVKDQASQAKAMGQLAVTYGVPEVKRRAADVWSKVGQAGQAGAARFTSSPGPAPQPRPAYTEPTGGDTAPESSASSEPRPQLAIPDYDELSASQVVDRLDDLGSDDLARVRDYEEANRGRRTILGKIDQLASR